MTGKDDVRYCFGLPNHIATPIVMASFIAASLGCVYYNKKIFAGQLPYVVFVSWGQQVIGMLIMSMFLCLKNKFSSDTESKSSSIPLKKRLYRYRYAFPVAFCFCMNISLNNLCLKTVKVSTYSVAKSTTLIWSLILQYIMLSIKVRCTTILACLIIVSGVIVGASDKASLSIYGLSFGCLSSLFQSIYGVTLKWAVPHVDNSTSELLLHVQELASVLFIILSVLVGEFYGVWYLSGCFSPIQETKRFFLQWGRICASAFLAILLNQCAYLNISLTTPATHNVCGLVKQALQSLGGWIILGDDPSIRSILSVTLCLSGSTFYTASKYLCDSSTKDSKVEDREKEAARCSVGTASEAYENPVENCRDEENEPLASDKCERGYGTNR